MRTHSKSGMYVTALLAIIVASAGGVTTAEAQRGPSRLRYGVEGGAGGAWGTPRGPSLGIFGQIGYQFDDTFAIFYQPSLYVHAIGTSDDADLFLASGNIAMGDVSFGPLQLGFGGGFDFARWDDCENDVCTRGPLEVHPAVAGRVALVARLHAPRHRRVGIPFGLQVHTAFLDGTDRLTSLLLTVGVQHY